MNGKISIIVPVYNKEAYLVECMESLAQQTYPDFEVLLVDDGSTDGSLNIAQTFCERDSRFHSISQKNGGQNAARKTGVEHAAGNWIVFVDADDTVAPGMCEVLMRRQRETDADIVYGNTQKSYAEAGEGVCQGWGGVLSGKSVLCNVVPIGRRFTKEDHRDVGFKGGILPCGMIPLLIRKSLILNALQHMDLRIRFAEDVGCMFYALLRAERVSFTPEIVYYYNRPPGSATRDHQKSCLLSAKWLQAFLEKQFRGRLTEGESQELICCFLIPMLLYGGYEFFQDFPGIYPFCAAKLKRGRLAIYGAGVIGTEMVTKLSGIDVVGWFDRDFKRYQAMGMPVQSPEEISNCDFDAMVIAIYQPELAEKIYQKLKIELPANTKIYTLSDALVDSPYTKQKFKELHDVKDDYAYPLQ